MKNSVRVPRFFSRSRLNLARKIIKKMESGNLKWLRPWKYPGLRMPFNPISKTRYSGVNVAYLLMEAEESGYADPRWITYVQAQKKGLRVKSGARGTKIEYWSEHLLKIKHGTQMTPIENADAEDVLEENCCATPKKYCCRVYTVFNGTQVEGLPPWNVDVERREVFSNNGRCEKIINGCGVPINYGTPGASYSFDMSNPKNECIRMPKREWFKDESHFYATVLHEIAHSTGNPLRMNRDMNHPAGTREYALEELRAEFASAFVLMDMCLALDDEGMEEHIKQHAAYLKHWRKIANESAYEFASAIQDAREIADVVLSYEVMGL